MQQFKLYISGVRCRRLSMQVLTVLAVTVGWRSFVICLHGIGGRDS